MATAQLTKSKTSPKFKSSGIDWLGDILNEWEVKKLKFTVKELVGGGTPDTGDDQNWTDNNDGTPWVNIADMTRSFRIRETEKKVTIKGLLEKNLRILPKGTLLYSMYASLGKVAVLNIDAVTNQAILGIVESKDKAAIDFIKWWLISIERHLLLFSSSSTQNNLNEFKVKNMPIFLPPLSQQGQIANFLDHEADKLDGLIDKKQQLIKKLNEKRTAIIGNAITKGLNPQAKFKPSGFDWIGSIPSNWELSPLFVGMSERQEKNLGLIEKNLLSLSYGRIIKKDIESNFGLLPESFETYQIVNPDDIILRLTDLQNDKKSLRVGYVTQRGIITSAYLCLRVNSLKLLPSYAYLLLHYFDTTKLFYNLGASVRQSMDFTDLKRIPIVFPPKNDQQKIIDFINQKTEKMDKAIKKLRQQIEFVEEYRLALITNAVTGKIKVN